jgi:transcriptional regulator with XRE-family HTH domain
MAHQFSGQQLRTLREAAGIKREVLAVALDRSFSTVVKWERAEMSPTARDIGMMAETLGVGVEELFAEPLEATA